MEIFFSEYAERWCLGVNLDEKTALIVQQKLKIGWGLGRTQYQVLANDETKNYEEKFNLIINNYEKSELKKLIPELKKLFDKNDIEY
ncbi:hypothetical protein ACSXCN_06715 [Clostridium perfringens]